MKALLALLLSVLVPSLAAQSSGARGGIEARDPLPPDPSQYAVEHYVTIEGSAEVRVDPTSIRVVLAITSQAESASACQQDGAKKLQALLAAWQTLGIDPKAAVVDLIAMLPVYEWEVKSEGEKRVAVERLTGYRLQNNVHLVVAGEEQAQAAVGEAFKVGITDVIAFDYWNADIDKHKAVAQRNALAQAQRKAELLLGALGTAKPLPINVHEVTQVVWPKDLYESFENAYQGQYQSSWRDNMPQIAAARPRNTYYRGFYQRVDAQDAAMPVRPQISVVSRVKLYFAAPELEGKREGKNEEKGPEKKNEKKK